MLHKFVQRFQVRKNRQATSFVLAMVWCIITLIEFSAIWIQRLGPDSWKAD